MCVCMPAVLHGLMYKMAINLSRVLFARGYPYWMGFVAQFSAIRRELMIILCIGGRPKE